MKRVIIIVGAIVSVCAAQQLAEIHAHFERQVPAEHRSEFCSILQRGIDAQERRDWPSLYRITIPQHRGKSLKEFVHDQRERNMRISNFRIVRIDSWWPVRESDKNGMWTVVGCAVVKEKKETTSRHAAGTVYLDNGNWYVDEIGVMMRPGNPVPLDSRCQFDEAIDVSGICGSARQQ